MLETMNATIERKQKKVYKNKLPPFRAAISGYCVIPQICDFSGLIYQNLALESYIAVLLVFSLCLILLIYIRVSVLALGNNYTINSISFTQPWRMWINDISEYFMAYTADWIKSPLDWSIPQTLHRLHVLQWWNRDRLSNEQHTEWR